MKKRMLALALSVILALSLMAAGCGSQTEVSSDTAAETEIEQETTTVYGEFVSADDSSITVKAGTLKDMTQTESGSDSSTSDTQTPPDKPEGDSGAAETADSSGSGTSDMQTPPDKPEGDSGTADVTDSSGSGASDTQTPPEKPAGDSSTSDTQAPPEKPAGDSSTAEASDSSGSGASDAQTPPEKPEGDNSESENFDAADGQSAAPQGQAPTDNGQSAEGGMDMPSMLDLTGEEVTYTITDDTDLGELSLTDLAEGDVLVLTVDAAGNVLTLEKYTVNRNMGQSMGGGQTSGVDSYTAVTQYSSDASSEGETFTSTGTDENAVLVTDDANVTISDASVNRTSSDSTGGDNSSFYGVGAAMLVTDGTLTVDNSTITTDADGAAGVFAYGDGTAYVTDTTIKTSQDTSGGIHVAGGGTLYASNLDVETNGESSAAIRSDRGGGTMVVDGGTYTANGVGSPAIYSTANIAVRNANLTANGSEAICIEGLNDIHLFDCNLTGNMSDSSQNDCTWNVILYQSMSGDSEVGNSTFEMNGGSLTAKNGGMFYTTNTESTITLSDVDITYADENDFFLKVTGNSNERGWGTSGANGADCLFTAINQDMQGDIIWDSISTLDAYLTQGTTFTGAVIDDESCAGNGGSGTCSLYIDKDSTWVVTGDSTLTSLYCSGTITDSSGRTVTIMNTDGTVLVQGTSSFTITVEEYSTTVDMSGASALTEWSDYAG